MLVKNTEVKDKRESVKTVCQVFPESTDFKTTPKSPTA
jgi:hypothetical protein